jgi:hypothetical protein
MNLDIIAAALEVAKRVAIAIGHVPFPEEVTRAALPKMAPEVRAWIKRQPGGFFNMVEAEARKLQNAEEEASAGAQESDDDEGDEPADLDGALELDEEGDLGDALELDAEPTVPGPTLHWSTVPVWAKGRRVTGPAEQRRCMEFYREHGHGGDQNDGPNFFLVDPDLFDDTGLARDGSGDRIERGWPKVDDIDWTGLASATADDAEQTPLSTTALVLDEPPEHAATAEAAAPKRRRRTRETVTLVSGGVFDERHEPILDVPVLHRAGDIVVHRTLTRGGAGDPTLPDRLRFQRGAWMVSHVETGAAVREFYDLDLAVLFAEDLNDPAVRPAFEAVAAEHEALLALPAKRRRRATRKLEAATRKFQVVLAARNEMLLARNRENKQRRGTT